MSSAKQKSDSKKLERRQDKQLINQYIEKINKKLESNKLLAQKAAQILSDMLNPPLKK